MNPTLHPYSQHPETELVLALDEEAVNRLEELAKQTITTLESAADFPERKYLLDILSDMIGHQIRSIRQLVRAGELQEAASRCLKYSGILRTTLEFIRKS